MRKKVKQNYTTTVNDKKQKIDENIRSEIGVIVMLNFKNIYKSLNHTPLSYKIFILPKQNKYMQFSFRS